MIMMHLVSMMGMQITVIRPEADRWETQYCYLQFHY